MTPWAIIGGLVAAIAAFFYGQHVGEASAEATQAAIDKAALKAREASAESAAEAIAKLRPKYVTLKQETIRDIQTNHVYSDCKLPAPGVRRVNAALTGQGLPTGDSELPATDPAPSK